MLAAIGSTLVGMVMSLLTGPMIKRLIIIGLETAVSKYERRAEKTADKEDDEIAKAVRKVLEEAKAAWK